MGKNIDSYFWIFFFRFSQKRPYRILDFAFNWYIVLSRATLHIRVPPNCFTQKILALEIVKKKLHFSKIFLTFLNKNPAKSKILGSMAYIG